MIVVICTIAVWLIFMGTTHYRYGWDWESFFFSFLVGIGGALVGLIILLISCGIFVSQPLEDCRIDMKDRTELVALKDNFQIEGSAFLFSSVVDENLHYTYIYETDMGMTTNSIDSSNAYIKYIEANETPYIQTWYVRPHSDFIHWLFCPGYSRYTIYLPEGSVIENVYEVDLQ
jgi:hypothetical protein